MDYSDPRLTRELAEAKQRNEELERDARRWRFLRNQDIETQRFPRSGVFIGSIPEKVVLTHEDADEAVDALAAQAKEESC